MNVELQNYYLDQLGITRWLSRTDSETTDVTLETKAPNQAQAPIADGWESLQTQVANCRACSLCEARTQTVFGVGDQQADLLIVGEAPGFNEDQQGEPFVGRAGQLLDEMLRAFGLVRQQVYIANVLKCRPPNNRDPQITEVAQCTPFLLKQVELLQPKVILAVGRHAAHFLLESNAALSTLRGHWHQFRDTNIPLLVSYHPAYLLRNPIDKRKAFADWQLLAERMA